MKKKSTSMDNSILDLVRTTYRLMLLSIFLLFSTCVFAQQISVTLTADKTTWTVPCGVSSITVEAWGGGGGGGVRNNTNNGIGPGGGGGAYSRITIPVKVGDSYTYSIGVGGIAGTDGTSNVNNTDVYLDRWESVKNGKETIFSFNGGTLTANGGTGALDNTTKNVKYCKGPDCNNRGQVGNPLRDVDFGAGGLASTNPLSGAPFVSYPGGKGGDAPSNSGGGGGAGQYGGAGGNASGSTGGSSTLPGGNGGNGVTNNTDGINGASFGGGGSGGNKKSSTTRNGGKGGDGGIKITYTLEPAIQPAASITSDKGNSLNCSAKDIILTANGGTTGYEVSNLWYQGNLCPTYAYINEFSEQLATDNTSAGKLLDGNQTLTATSNDPMIHMEEVLLEKGTVDVAKYKYLTIRYRVTTAPAGNHNFEIYFKKAGQSLSEDKVVRKSINIDGNWHILNIDMSTHSYNSVNNWNNSNGEVTGWRFDYSTVSGTIIDLDYIVLSDTPAIETSSSDSDDSKIKVSPTAEMNNYKVIKISELDRCINRSTNCTNIEVTRTNNTFKSATGFWNDKLNWSRGVVPINEDCVIIPLNKNVEINIKDAVAKNVKVEAGGKLTITKDNALTVTDAFINESGVANVVIESDGNLKQNTNNPVPPNSGAITAKRNIKFRSDQVNTAREEYNYLISPLVGQSLKTLYPGVPTTSTYPYILYHNEANNYFYNSTGAYIAGRALAVKEPSKAHVVADNIDAVFKGELTNGIINYPLAFTNNVSLGYNLVGNPYPSNIDLRELYILNGGSLSPAQPPGKITSTFYFWDNSANNVYQQQGSGYSGRAYAVYNAYSGMGNKAGYLLNPDPANSIGAKKPNKIAKVGQGFMVRAVSSGKTLVFDNSIRVTDQTDVQFFNKNANSTDNRYWLQLITPSNLVNSIAVIHFEGGADTFGMDDSELNVSSSDMFYSLAEDHQLQIEGRPSFVDTDKIILGSAHYVAGNYTIALGDKEGIFEQGQNIYLKDKKTGTVTNLSEGNYTFAANAGASTGRFEIMYKPETVLVTDSKVKQGIIVYRAGHEFVLKSPKTITTVEVYDLSGKLMTVLKPNSKQGILEASKIHNGIYVLKITTTDGEVTNKKISK